LEPVLGAGIYAGTFLLGNNWDYRLIFLLFTVPQLAEWTRQKNGFFTTLARITLGALIVSCWYLVLVKWFSIFKYGHPLAYLLDESELDLICQAGILICPLSPRLALRGHRAVWQKTENNYTKVKHLHAHLL
jgi:hypothetical protein